jgi:hypothetical protein
VNDKPIDTGDVITDLLHVATTHWRLLAKNLGIHDGYHSLGFGARDLLGLLLLPYSPQR